METIVIAYNWLKHWEQSLSEDYFGVETLFAAAKTGTIWMVMNIIIASEIEEWAKASAAILGVLLIAFKLGTEIYKWRKRKDLYGKDR